MTTIANQLRKQYEQKNAARAKYLADCKAFCEEAERWLTQCFGLDGDSKHRAMVRVSVDLQAGARVAAGQVKVQIVPNVAKAVSFTMPVRDGKIVVQVGDADLAHVDDFNMIAKTQEESGDVHMALQGRWFAVGHALAEMIAEQIEADLAFG